MLVFFELVLHCSMSELVNAAHTSSLQELIVLLTHYLVKGCWRQALLPLNWFFLASLREFCVNGSRSRQTVSVYEFGAGLEGFGIAADRCSFSCPLDLEFALFSYRVKVLAWLLVVRFYCAR